MTTKERLHQLVDELPDERAAELLELARTLAASPAQPATPSWVGALHSGRGDLSERHEEIIRDEFGRAV